jgi:DNA-binding transcriptional ArsR family regulator
MSVNEKFGQEIKELATFSKALSNPARLAILQYLSKTKSCISGDISTYIPLSRTTVSQHLKVLRDSGLIKGEIDGPRINYCINVKKVEKYLKLTEEFFAKVRLADVDCPECNE